MLSFHSSYFVRSCHVRTSGTAVPLSAKVWQPTHVVYFFFACHASIDVRPFWRLWQQQLWLMPCGKVGTWKHATCKYTENNLWFMLALHTYWANQNVAYTLNDMTKDSTRRYPLTLLNRIGLDPEGPSNLILEFPPNQHEPLRRTSFGGVFLRLWQQFGLGVIGKPTQQVAVLEEHIPADEHWQNVGFLMATSATFQTQQQFQHFIFGAAAEGFTCRNIHNW